MDQEKKHIWTGVFNWIDFHDAVVKESYAKPVSDYTRGINTGLANCLSLVRSADADGVDLYSINYDQLYSKDEVDINNYQYGVMLGVLKFKKLLLASIKEYANYKKEDDTNGQQSEKEQ